MDFFKIEFIVIGTLLLLWLLLLSYYVYGMAERQFKSRGKKMKKSWLQHLVRDRKLTPRKISISYRIYGSRIFNSSTMDH